MTVTGVELRDVQADTINIQGVTVSGATAEELVAEFERRGLLAGAELAGLQRRTIITLAQRLRPAERLDFEQAVTELERAVEVALDVIGRGERGTNDDAFVHAVLAQVAERIRRDDLDGAAAELVQAHAQLDAEHKRSTVALFEEEIKVHTLRRDAVTVAQRIEQVVGIEHPAERPAWQPEFRTRLDAFASEGEIKGINFSLSVAIEMARLMLTTARTGNERNTARELLGTGLAHLGRRESGTVRLEEAVATFRETLSECTQEGAPPDWASTQNNLGNALALLGERESSIDRLEEAIGAFYEALKEWTRERVPLQWAMTQTNLGNVLKRLGERESGTSFLKQAIIAYREALKEWTRERVPLDWASTQNNLGSALALLGERERSIDRLEEAIDAFREALKEWKRERVPLRWALAQNNLGGALLRIGERESSARRLRKAVTALRAALQERTRERVPLDWAQTQSNLGTALYCLGEREGSVNCLNEAITAFQETLKERTRERVPLQWAITHINLGAVLKSLGERESGTDRLKQAIAAYDAALEVFVAAKADHYIKLTQRNRARALMLLEQRREQPP